MKKIFSVHIMLAIATIMSFSCNGLSSGKVKSVQDTIMAMQANRLMLSLGQMARYVPDNDTARVDTSNYHFFLVMYVDSTKCSPCVLDKMYQWNSLIDKTRTEGNHVGYVFIFEPKAEQVEDAKFAVESSGLKNCIYLDTAHVFRQDNKFMPKSSKYHVVLINKNDSILLVGDPNKNKSIQKMFLNTVNKQL